MKRALRSYLKRALFALGIDLKRLSILDNPHRRLQILLDQMHIATVFDVGANAGQFALTLRELGYNGKIYSIEPLSSAYDSLLINSKNDNFWVIYPRCALSDVSGIGQIQISQNSVSSSLSQILSNHLSLAPESQVVANESVATYTLDHVFSQLNTSEVPLDCELMLKIDAQGYEFNILNGAAHSLQHFMVLMIEMSTEKMYQDEKKMTFLCEWLTDRGFDLWSLYPAFADKTTGRVFQYDGIFVNRTALQTHSFKDNNL